MNSSSLIAIVGLMTVGTSFGASGIFGSYINVTSSNHGGTPTWYDVQPPGGGRASDPTDFNGFSFGSFDPNAGGTLNLTGAEVLTFKNDGSDVTGAAISYRVYLTASTPPGFTSIGIGFTSNATFADAAGTNYSGGGDQKWSNGVGSTNLLSGLPNGNYSLEAFLSAPSSDGTHFSNAGGANYTASFTVVPESASAALGMLGSILLLRRRK
jgi:hypothetical protein